MATTPDLINLESKLTKKDSDLSGLSAEQQFSLIRNRSRELIDGPRLLGQMKNSKETGTPLRIKYGIDPTAKDIHLGHVVPIIVARRFLQMGHHVIILFGDFTAFVGDPSGRVSTRPLLTAEEISANVASYRAQVGKFIEVDKVEIAFNSAFYKPNSMDILDIFRIFRQNSVAPLLQREDFRKRKHDGLTIAETLYPTLMAIDSIKIGAQVELGGIDQLLNFQVAKMFMEHAKMEPETAVTTELLESTAGDGKKMSKSEGNYISLSASPGEIYGKLMSIPDKLMEQYFKLLTDITDEEWAFLSKQMETGLISPKDTKQLLARVIVTWIHDESSAREAEHNFAKIFSSKEVPENIPTMTLEWREGLTLIDVFNELRILPSKSAFRRLIASRSIKLMTATEMVVTDPETKVKKGEAVVKYGRGKFVKIVVR